MGKFIKPGKIVIVLAGRYAGRKAIVVKTFDEGSKELPFGHALVAGIDRQPLRVTKRHSVAQIKKRSNLKPFIKFINFNHLMPTRYTIADIDVKTHVKPESVKKTGDGRIEAKKAIKKAFQDRYLNRGKNTAGVQYFYSKLRF